MLPLLDALTLLKPVTSALHGGFYFAEGCTEADRCLAPSFGHLGAVSKTIRRGVYVWFFRPARGDSDGTYMHPLNMQLLLDCTG